MEGIDPTVRAYFDLGLSHYNKGEFLKAAEQWRLAVEHDPKFVEAHRYLALAYERLGWKHKAKKQWEQYLKFETDPVAREKIQTRLRNL